MIILILKKTEYCGVGRASGQMQNLLKKRRDVRFDGLLKVVGGKVELLPPGIDGQPLPEERLSRHRELVSVWGQVTKVYHDLTFRWYVTFFTRNILEVTFLGGIVKN